MLNCIARILLINFDNNGNLVILILRNISSISDITAIEGYIKTIIYSKDRFKRMSAEEKLQSFGEFFHDSRQNFIFLPDEKTVILAAV